MRDAGMRAMPAAEGAIARYLFRHDHIRGQIHLHAAVALRRHDGFETQGRRLAQQCDCRVEIAVLHVFNPRRDFLVEEIARRTPDRFVLVGDVFGRENVRRKLILDQK